MRVLLISGTYPPDRCGVGDYAAHLAERLSRAGGMEVGVLTGNAAAVAEVGGPLLIHGTGWAVRLADAYRAVRGFRPDVVHVEYPTMRPVSRWIPVIVARALGVPVVQTWHEHYSECGQLGALNLLGLKRLIYVREDMLRRLPRHVSRAVASAEPIYVPNGCTIPPIRLAPEVRERESRDIGGGRPVVAYFGFAYPNKDVHQLFEIADPSIHHLLLICSLDADHPYQKRLLDLVESARWRGHATVTGFVPPELAGRLLATADAAVFPFSGGIGHWNTSVKAALASGTFVLGTTVEPSRAGYDAEQNLCLVPCGDLDALRVALRTYAGRRREPSDSDDWRDIVLAHRRVYSSAIDT